MSKYLNKGKHLKKKEWREISERIGCASDLLGIMHQDARLSARFKEELHEHQLSLEIWADIFWKKSLTKAEKKEIGLV